MKKRVVFGFLGTVLDLKGKASERWNRWRPTISLGQQDDLLIDKFELLVDTSRFKSMLTQVTEDFASVSPETKFTVHNVQVEDPWDFAQVYSSLFDFARSYPFDTENYEYLVHITTGTHVVQICLFLLTEARWFPGKLLQTSPPVGKANGQVGTYKIIDLDLSQYDSIASRFRQTVEEGVSVLKSGIATKNESFNLLMNRIEKVALLSTEPILITGPTGAGKSQLARRVFQLKQLRQCVGGSFVEVNCATLTGDQAMSALFGHTKGAFTGAVSDRPGLLRTADGGMLFLDEIGELGLNEQTMLLRALEEKRFMPVGADAEVSSDFQLIAGTNRDLIQDVADGRFREDLLARINLWSFELPGLSKRKEDIEPNISYELNLYSERSGKSVSFSAEAKERFLTFAHSDKSLWKANFRDLNGSLKRLTTLAEGGRITKDLVDEEIDRLQKNWNPAKGASISLVSEILAEQADQLDRFDRVQLEEVLLVCRESKSLSEAGRSLFSISRTEKKNANDADRLRKYLAKFGLDWESIQK